MEVVSLEPDQVHALPVDALPPAFDFAVSCFAVSHVGLETSQYLKDIGIELLQLALLLHVAVAYLDVAQDFRVVGRHFLQRLQV